MKHCYSGFIRGRRRRHIFGAIAAAAASLDLQTEDLANLTTEDGEQLETDF